MLRHSYYSKLRHLRHARKPHAEQYTRGTRGTPAGQYTRGTRVTPAGQYTRWPRYWARRVDAAWGPRIAWKRHRSASLVLLRS